MYLYETGISNAWNLLDLIMKWGAMDGLFGDNSKDLTSNGGQDKLHQYNIDDMQSDPEGQHKYPAEQRIKEVKSLTNNIRYRPVSHKYLWLLSMFYVLSVLNCLGDNNLVMRTPLRSDFCLLRKTPFL